MSNYESAPSTLMLATRCVCCGRALRDAESVERGVGPDCAEKYGYAVAQKEADWAAVEAASIELTDATVFARLTAVWGQAHKAANVLVHHAACVRKGQRKPFVKAIAALGFTMLATKLGYEPEVVADLIISVTRKADCYACKTPYRGEFVHALKAARVGAHWNKVDRVWEVPATEVARRALWQVLQATFAGETMLTERGPVQITAPARQAA